MKKIFLSLMLVPVFGLSAQSDDTVHQFVDIMPVLASCASKASDSEAQRCSQLAIIEHLRQNMKLTKAEVENGVQGTVLVSFVVSKDGRATQPNIERGISPDLDQSVKDAVLTLPAFEAGRLHAQPVNTRLSVPMKVSLNQ